MSIVRIALWMGLFGVCVSSSAQGRLWTFLQPQDTLFARIALPSLRKVASEQSLALRVVRSMDSVPKPVTATPAIVFQHMNGLSIYAGRYTEVNSIEQFVRLNQIIQQSSEPMFVEHVLQSQIGLMTSAIKVKVTEQRDISARQQVLDQIFDGWDNYRQAHNSRLEKTDRLFYLDIHPHKASSGEWQISYEVFSPFHCLKPVYSQLNTPILTECLTDGLSKLRREVEEVIENVLKLSRIGDAMTPLPTTITYSTLPTFENDIDSRRETNIDWDVTGEWFVSGAIRSGAPLVAFAFPEPLSRYAGEFAGLKGSLQVNTQRQIKSGEFALDVSTLSMGMKDLNTKVISKYLKAHIYPSASFVFDSIDQMVLSESLMDGPIPCQVQGTFSLMGKTLPIIVQASFNQGINQNGDLELHVEGSFEIPLRPFKIKGPDGPQEASEKVQCYIQFALSKEKF